MRVAIAKQPIKAPNIAKGIVINSNNISPGFLKGLNNYLTLCNINKKTSALRLKHLKILKRKYRSIIN